jgi:hypothetical protein
MAHLFTGDDKFTDLTYDDAYRSYLITRTDRPGDYRFSRSQGKRVRVQARSALRRVNGFLKNIIVAIANSKMRRMQRELALRGIVRPAQRVGRAHSRSTQHSRELSLSISFVFAITANPASSNGVGRSGI